MSASSATIIYVALIVCLMYRSFRTSEKVSAALWIPTLWVAIICSRPVSYWFVTRSRPAQLDGYLDGSPIDRNVYIALMAIGVLALARRRLEWTRILVDNKWLWIFYLYLGLSTVWAEFPAVALKRWFKDLGNVIMVLIIVTEPRPSEAIRKVFLRCAYVLVPLSILFIKYYPDMGRYYHRWTYQVMYGGVTINKNSLGVLAMIAGLLLVWTLAEKHRGWWHSLRYLWGEWIVLGMSAWILTMADSATSLVCFIIGVVTLYACRSGFVARHMTLTVSTGVGLALFMAAFTVMPSLRAVIVGGLGRDVTLTGRTIIWETVLAMGTNPLFGEGFASVWLTPAGAEISLVTLRLVHAHNGYVETYLNSGLIGLGLLLAVLLTAGKNSATLIRARSPLAPMYLAMFVSGLIYNYTEVTFNNNNVVGFFLWLMATGYSRRDVPIAAAHSVPPAAPVAALRQARLRVHRPAQQPAPRSALTLRALEIRERKTLK